MKNRLNLFNCIENSANVNQGTQPGQYLTHAHSHIMRAVAATDSFNCIENSANLNQGTQPGQYLTHAHSHIMRAVAATDSCFTLSGAHQRVKAVGLMNEKPCVLKPPLLLRRVESSPSSASSTKHLWELLAGNRTAVLPRHARERWIKSYII